MGPVLQRSNLDSLRYTSSTTEAANTPTHATIHHECGTLTHVVAQGRPAAAPHNRTPYDLESDLV